MDSRGLEKPTSRNGESQWKISLERILMTRVLLYVRIDSECIEDKNSQRLTGMIFLVIFCQIRKLVALEEGRKGC